MEDNTTRREKEISKVAEEVLKKNKLNIVFAVTGDEIYPENRIDFKLYMERYQCPMDKVTERINSGFV